MLCLEKKNHHKKDSKSELIVMLLAGYIHIYFWISGNAIFPALLHNLAKLGYGTIPSPFKPTFREMQQTQNIALFRSLI